jgi:mannose-6-phosphate isomerase-like protein (cupin superfamily)
MNSTLVAVVNIAQKLSSFSDHWSPKIVGILNDHKVQVVKLKGPFEWHHHEKEDELFLVISGNLVIHFRDRDITIQPGEFVIIPHMLEHKPEAQEEVQIVLIEPQGAVNTGNITTDKTVSQQESI